jgi:hypothetical protein
VQDVQDLVVAQRFPVQLTTSWAAEVPAGEGQVLVVEGLDDGAGRPGGGEGVQQERERAPNAGVGIQDHRAGRVVDQPDRQAGAQFTAAGLGQQPALHPCPQEMQFTFGHGALEPQKHPVVEAGRVIEPVFIQDEGVVVGAYLQQPVPVGVVAGQTGTFQAQHDPGPAQGHLGDQVLEPFPVGG